MLLRRRAPIGVALLVMSAAFDTATWLGVDVLGVMGKQINLGVRVRAAFKAMAEDGTLLQRTTYLRTVPS